VSNPWPGTFFPPQVAALYDYPSNLTGKGQNVAIMSFNNVPVGSPGGYSPSALKTYFTKVLGGSAPNLTNVTVMGPGNDPGPDTPGSDQQGDSTGEVMLDACVVGSVAPGANIFMYFTEFTTQGWVDALQEAIAGDNDISVISISYGNPEDDPQGAWTPAGVQTVNQAFQAAIAAGITICCASGDDGSSDQVASGAHVDFPASSPYVLGVGGTKLTASSLAPPAIRSEVVWNELAQSEGAGGGGISVLFTKPSWQDGVNVPPSANPPHQIGRGVPDVAADADPLSGVVVMRVDGKHLEPIGGTSAAAPLWASLIARLNEGLNTRCGFINPVLYTRFAQGVLNDITSGNNGAYAAGVGWDACTGLGTPNGTKLLSALSTSAVAAKRKLVEQA
jgi:kumamolisin